MNDAIQLFGTSMHAWSMARTVDVIDQRIASRTFTQHAVVNVAKLVNCAEDASLREALERCDIVNIDGMGVVWGARLLGFSIGERVAGIDLFGELLALSAKRKYPVFFLGARQQVLDQALFEAKRRYSGLIVAGSHHGYYDDEREVAEAIRRSGASLLFVAMTTPKKEIFIDRWREQLGVSFAMGVGGSFDVMAGATKRAPRWMQSAGLEWFYRTLQEPGRLWKRYLVTNTKFAYLLARERIRKVFAQPLAKGATRNS